MNHDPILTADTKDQYDVALAALDAAKDRWAQTDAATRVTILHEVKTALMSQANGWATAAARAKRLPAKSPLVGEEWLTGPYGVMMACNGLINTLTQLENKAFLSKIPYRMVAGDRMALKVLPLRWLERLIMSGLKAEVWMERGVDLTTLSAASAYDIPRTERKGKVALVLGAGNVAAISPLDAFQKLFTENQVVLLKMNPVNDYLTDYLEVALKPLIDRDALRIVRGGGAAGAYLTEHPLVEEIHITGAGSTHDLIVWGPGKVGEDNRQAGTPKNNRKITSELGAVCPTIVVPGPWSKADIRFQAENIATQKLQNSGYNCVACQTLILPDGWDKTDALMEQLRTVMATSGQRDGYYPGSERRLKEFAAHGGKAQIGRGPGSPAVHLADYDKGDREWLANNEVFAPALTTKSLTAKDAESYLQEAIRFANEQLFGTLGANIIIHPATIRAMGRTRFEELISDLRYGTIAINTWTGVGFLLTVTPWGGFPGATLREPGSGIGTVHNTFMLERTERTVIEAPWRPFPRSFAALQFTLLPRPPWFITHSRQRQLGKLLTRLAYKPSLRLLPKVFWHALRG